MGHLKGFLKYLADVFTYIFGNPVKPGQIWEWSPRSPNPFETRFSKRYVVDEVKDGYVLYHEMLTARKESTTVISFMVDSCHIGEFASHIGDPPTT